MAAYAAVETLIITRDADHHFALMNPLMIFIKIIKLR